MNIIPRVNVLGVGLSAINMPMALQAISEAVAARKKGYISFLGVAGVNEAQTDPDLRRVFNQAFLGTPDGMPMVWVARLKGHRHVSRVYGPDLMLELGPLSVREGYRNFFYGGAPGVAATLATRWQKQFPGFNVCGVYQPPFRELTSNEEQALIQQVKLARPDLMWIGLGTPKQDKFMARYLPVLDTVLMLGVGAAFDFHAGKVRQAPRWIQHSGFEWLFRLSQDPRRLWKRYLKNNPLFVFRILCQLTGLRKYSLE